MVGALVRFRGIALLLTVALMVSLLGFAGRASAQGSAHDIMIRTLDFAFDTPAQIEAGVTSFTMRNDGQEPHHAQLAKLADGKTFDDLVAAFQTGNEGAIFAILNFVGGPGVAAPGTQVAKVTIDLSVGTYAWLCFVASPDGVPHFAKGMVKPMQVVAATGAPMPAPSTDGTIVLHDFRFEMPSAVNAGMQTWKVTNAGPQPHEMALLKLNPGKTLADVIAAEGAAGPPPYTSLGGMQGLNVGNSAWVTVDLQPATYVAICFIPDPATGKSHAELGMVAQFTVAGAGGAAPLPDTGEAPVPVELPNTGMEDSLPLLLALLAIGLLATGTLLRRRRA